MRDSSEMEKKAAKFRNEFNDGPLMGWNDRSVAAFALSVRDAALEEDAKLADNFVGLHRPADPETGQWYRGECHPACKACEFSAAIRAKIGGK